MHASSFISVFLLYVTDSIGSSCIYIFCPLSVVYFLTIILLPHNWRVNMWITQLLQSSKFLWKFGDHWLNVESDRWSCMRVEDGSAGQTASVGA